jgi:hypothetical protein
MVPVVDGPSSYCSRIHFCSARQAKAYRTIAELPGHETLFAPR